MKKLIEAKGDPVATVSGGQPLVQYIIFLQPIQMVMDDDFSTDQGHSAQLAGGWQYQEYWHRADAMYPRVRQTSPMPIDMFVLELALTLKNKIGNKMLDRKPAYCQQYYIWINIQLNFLAPVACTLNAMPLSYPIIAELLR